MSDILLVEDSETQALRLQMFLEAAGFQVRKAGSAADAMEMMGGFIPSLLITDQNLPGIQGDELCRRIRMNVATRDIPILILTGDETAEAERQGLESGADDYVRKTEDLDVLLIRVQSLLQKSRASDVIRAGRNGLATARVLVVEDSPTYRELLVHELRNSGFQVEAVGNAAGGLEALALGHYDAVILDMVLPDMQGEAMCRSYAGSRRTVDRAFVLMVLSGLEDKEEMNAALAAGADDVVGKSRDMDIIKARLGSLLRRKFMHEEKQEIARRFREKEMELARARTEKEAAEARAALSGKLAESYRQLQAANRELRATQAQLVQSAKMASLGQLVAGVAHEINNPLAFVKSHRVTVERGMDQIAPEIVHHLSETSRPRFERLQQRLKDMKLGIDRMEDLVTKLRTFSRLDEGEFKDVDIVDSIESVLTLLDHRLQGRITVERDFDPRRMLPCCPGPLNQVIMNVIANAIDAVGEQGTIHITTRCGQSDMTIAIADTGCGIPGEIRERIFDPFFTTKPVGLGTGLGLSIAYGIVRRHGGTLQVRSEEGKGTEMHITLPLEPASVAAVQLVSRSGGAESKSALNGNAAVSTGHPHV